MNGVQARKVLKYAVMPEVMPRIRLLFGRGLGHVAFWMACIYNMVRLLPKGHPYLNPRNIGRFGVRHVIAEAANNLVFKKENADQIVIFTVLLVGLVLMGLQFFMIVYSTLAGPAMAASSFFVTPSPTTLGPGNTTPDIAFILLDQVFGVPNFFCAGPGGTICTGVMPGALPLPFHVALHSLFEFYSLGLMMCGLMVFLYFVLVVVFETATSGTPFGQRFQDVWVPIRIVVALGLLVPLNYGYNSAQYITLASAKYGSSFATNAWLRYNAAIKSSSTFSGGAGANPTGERTLLLARPMSPDISGMVQAMSIVQACHYAYWKLADPTGNKTAPVVPPSTPLVQAYFVKNAKPWNTDPNTFQAVTAGTTYLNALSFYDNSDIIIRFGQHDPALFPSETGNVKPYCGEIKIPVTDLLNPGQGGTIGGPDAIQQFYFDSIVNMWLGNPGVDSELAQLSAYLVEISNDNENSNPPATQPWQCLRPPFSMPQLPGTPNCQTDEPSSAAKQYLINQYQAGGLRGVNQAINQAWATYNTNGTDITISTAVLDRGWAGAGIWYNTIAQINGGFAGTIMNMPFLQRYPDVMNTVREAKRAASQDITGLDVYEPRVPSGVISFSGPESSLEIASILSKVHKYWNKAGANQANMDKILTNNILIDIMNRIMGSKGLLSVWVDNADIYPLAQLAALGKALVDASVLALGLSMIGAGTTDLLGMLDSYVGIAAEMATDILSSVSFIGLTAGVILYYILPFLPFLYFFFAVGTWVMSIFEAMVGAPLWALAHLRLDGEGLPGDAASGGYFLIFEIFTRPILSVFGLVAALIIFTAQVRVLHTIWELVIGNLSGVQGTGLGATGFAEEPRDVMDQFFYTIIYIIIVYMMATASFKLIDKIPDNILRWMGAGVSSFSDINPDPTEGLTQYAAIGGITIGQQITGAATGGARGLGGALAKAIKPTPAGP